MEFGQRGLQKTKRLHHARRQLHFLTELLTLEKALFHKDEFIAIGRYCTAELNSGGFLGWRRRLTTPPGGQHLINPGQQRSAVLPLFQGDRQCPDPPEST